VVFLFVIDAGLEAPSLLIAGDVQVELEDEDVVVEEHVLEPVDVVQMAACDLGGDELVNTRGEDVLVVGAVEDVDHAARGNLGVGSPEEVVARFKRGRHFEGGDVAALGVDAGKDMADGAVFAGCIHTLKDDEQGLALVGVEDVLQVCKLLPVFDQSRCGSLFGLVTTGVGC